MSDVEFWISVAGLGVASLALGYFYRCYMMAKLRRITALVIALIPVWLTLFIAMLPDEGPLPGDDVSLFEFLMIMLVGYSLPWAGGFLVGYWWRSEVENSRRRL